MDQKNGYFDCMLLDGLSAPEKEQAYAAAMPRVLSYTAGECVVSAGEYFGVLGIVTHGELSVIRSGEHRPVIHKRLAPPDVFGVSSLFGKECPFPTTVRADCESTVLLLDEASVERMLAAVPRVARNYIALLTEKIRFLNRRLDTLAGRSAEERVAAFLLTRVGRDGALGITKSALASTLGLGRASLYRILDGMQAAGIVRPHRDRIEILDTAALQQFINNRKE